MFPQLGPWIATIVASGLTGYVLFRSRTPKLLKDELEVTRERCQRFENENKVLVASNHEKDVEIADLKARTDLTEIQKTQREILLLCSNTAKSLISVAKTLESISRVLPLKIELDRIPRDNR